MIKILRGKHYKSNIIKSQKWVIKETKNENKLKGNEDAYSQLDTQSIKTRVSNQSYSSVRTSVINKKARRSVKSYSQASQISRDDIMPNELK